MARAPHERGPHRALPWVWAGFALAVVTVVYSVLAESPRSMLVSTVVTATVLGGLLGIATRDSQDRVVSVGYSLREGLRRLAHKLWY